jgi:hypothetical protein
VFSNNHFDGSVEASMSAAFLRPGSHDHWTDRRKLCRQKETGVGAQ